MGYFPSDNDCKKIRVDVRRTNLGLIIFFGNFIKSAAIEIKEGSKGGERQKFWQEIQFSDKYNQAFLTDDFKSDIDPAIRFISFFNYSPNWETLTKVVTDILSPLTDPWRPVYDGLLLYSGCYHVVDRFVDERVVQAVQHPDMVVDTQFQLPSFASLVAKSGRDDSDDALIEEPNYNLIAGILRAGEGDVFGEEEADEPKEEPKPVAKAKGQPIKKSDDDDKSFFWMLGGGALLLAMLTMGRQT